MKSNKNSIAHLRYWCEKYIDSCNYYGGGCEDVYNDAFSYCRGNKASNLLLKHFNIDI